MVDTAVDLELIPVEKKSREQMTPAEFVLELDNAVREKADLMKLEDMSEEKLLTRTASGREHSYRIELKRNPGTPQEKGITYFVLHNSEKIPQSVYCIFNDKEKDRTDRVLYFHNAPVVVADLTYKGEEYPTVIVQPKEFDAILESVNEF